ncbi:uncharacterized protein [Nicotiana sylvestris]|uniref:uncharacterized protein n=1 Tax=Nicotiana sylvestris TaxID=4096 RepID=UPI00388C4277
MICEPIFKMLKKDAATKWTEECQKAFDRIKEYLSIPPVLVLPKPGRPLLLYLSVLDGAFGCVLGQHDEMGRKEQAIYYLSKKFTPFEAVKGQTLADHLAENHVGGEYEPLKTYFPDEEVSFVGEDITKAYDSWRMFFDGAANFKGVGIRAVLVRGQHYPVSAKLRFSRTNNMAEYEACIMGLNLAIDINIQELLVIGDSDLLVHQVLGEWATMNSKIFPYLYHVQELMKRFTKIEFKHVSRIQNEFADALATLSSMIQHPDKNFIYPILVRIHNQPAYCAHVEEETDGNPWILLDDCGNRLYQVCPEVSLVSGTCRYDTVPPNELNATSAPWPFAAWGIDVIGPIEPAASNGHRFILAAVDYFTKWVEAASYKAVTKKVIVDFVKDVLFADSGYQNPSLPTMPPNSIAI